MIVSRPSTASPRRTTLAPLPSAIIAGLVTAATLTTLGAVSVFSMQRIMERAAVREMVSATTAVAFQLSPEVVDAAAAAARGRAPSDTAPAHQLGRLLATLVAALPGVSSYEVAAVHGDSMTVVASQAPAGGPDLPRAPERLGQTLPVASDVRSAWDADSVAIVSRLARSAGVDGIRVWVPVRQPGGRRVIAAVGALAAESRYGRIDQDMRRTIFAGLAISVALSLIAALGRFRAERSRAASDAQLVAAKEAAEATARSRGEFLANMSHEIRTPLHGVLGMTEALLAMPHTEADRRSLAVINRSASSLLGILNDILDYSKLEAGRVDLVNAPFDPRALVDDVTDLFAVRAEEKSLDLAARETARADHWPVGDAARIRQVLLNLVGNAVKFTERGSVQVELSTVAIGRKTIALRIAVRDTGIGIAPEVQERVFEQFSQAEGSTSRRFGGTGLGLTISRQLVLLMGGKISVASVPGEGSEFVVDLQLPASTMSSEPTVLRRFPMGERALVCTDLAGTRAALTELCVRERLAVTTCATTDEARDVLARSPEFAVTFCEMQPGMAAVHPLSGFRPPLVLLTTVHHPLNNSTLSSLGAVAQLRRPVRQDHFTALMNDVAAGALRVPEPDAPQAGAPAAISAAAPAAPAAAPPERDSPATATAIPGTAGAPRVLVVDDVDLNLLVAKAMLGSLNVQVRTASGGEEALDILSKESMDLVLMDCHMPGLDGYDVTRCVRGTPGPNRETPIVALSASAFAEDRERAMQSGMNDFATKPIELDSLRGVLERWTARAAT